MSRTDPAARGARSARSVRLVCFDLGGVLVRICRSWQEGCAAAGLEVRPGGDDPVLVARRRAISQAYSLGQIDCGTCFRALAASTGGRYSPVEIERLHDAWLLGEYPGVGEVVDRLFSNPRVRTGVLSNTNHRHWSRQLFGAGRRPTAYPSLARLRNRHASHILGLAKPDPRIYRTYSCSVAVDPERILFFDDLEENVAAAAASGWRAVRIDHTGDTAAQMESALAAHGVC